MLFFKLQVLLDFSSECILMNVKLCPKLLLSLHCSHLTDLIWFDVKMFYENCLLSLQRQFHTMKMQGLRDVSWQRTYSAIKHTHAHGHTHWRGTSYMTFHVSQQTHFSHIWLQRPADCWGWARLAAGAHTQLLKRLVRIWLTGRFCLSSVTFSIRQSASCSESLLYACTVKQ